MNKRNLTVLGIVLAILLTVIVAAAVYMGAFGGDTPSVGNNTATPEPMTPSTDEEAFDDFMCITVTVGANPKSDKNFCWQTFDEIQSCVIQYAPKSGDVLGDVIGSAEFEALSPASITAVSESQSLMIPENGQYDYKNPSLKERMGYIHRAYLTGLEAGKEYFYRVGDGNENWSSVASFRTEPEELEQYSFIYVTDTQGFTQKDFSYWGRLIKTADKKYPDAEFILHLGDTVEEGKNQYQWTMFFNAADDLLRSRTVITVAGNKDKQHTLRRYTNGAEDNRTALVSGYFSFDYGDVHFTVLYTGDGDKDISKSQLRWLENDLSEAEGKRKIVMLHKAPYSDANHTNDVEIVAIREQLLPVFDKYGVNLVLQGHDHYFFRSKPVYDKKTAEYTAENLNIDGDMTKMIRLAADGRGTVYFMNGSAGVKQHSGVIGSQDIIYTDESFLTEAPSYSYCSVDKEKIVFKTYTVDESGSETLIDAWGMYWNAGLV